mgnify:FL=1|jgi:1-deoxy-D-xylulose-5-phosphate reductoisomerase
MAKRITILGSTGSIGQSTLDIVRNSLEGMFEVVALTANKNAKLLAEQAIEFNAQYVALSDSSNADILKEMLKGLDVKIGTGPESLIEAASYKTDFCMAAIIGAAGLEPTLAAVNQGINIGLANKECIVTAGDLFTQRVKEKRSKLLPVDSEHNAIFQVLDIERPSGVRRLILTASGGPFRSTPINEMRMVTKESALRHPVWSMGAKISIDSATLMNKGLELIEASYLFNRPSKEIDIIIHPQSIVHSMVEYIDGSILAQLGSPDMRIPIAYSMAWPDRMNAHVDRLDLTAMDNLNFFKPDLNKFPALNLARFALETGGTAPCVINAANEVAVDAFLQDKIEFLDITRLIDGVLGKYSSRADFKTEMSTIEEVISKDNEVRKVATENIKKLI